MADRIGDDEKVVLSPESDWQNCPYRTKVRFLFSLPELYNTCSQIIKNYLLVPYNHVKELLIHCKHWKCTKQSMILLMITLPKHILLYFKFT